MKGSSADVWLKLDLPNFWRLVNQYGQGLKLLYKGTTQPWNFRLVVTD